MHISIQTYYTSRVMIFMQGFQQKKDFTVMFLKRQNLLYLNKDIHILL